MDVPKLPPLVTGRSALPAFLPVEAWAQEQLRDAGEDAKRTLEEARVTAARIRAEGEAALRDLVLEGEAEAVRMAETRARDRVSAARLRLQAWIEASEVAAQTALDEAMRRICEP